MALYLARPLKHRRTLSDPDPRDMAAVLGPGDVLLTEGNSRMAALVRLVTRSSWAHVAMYVGGGQMIHSPRTGETVKVVAVNWAKVRDGIVGRPGSFGRYDLRACIP